MSGTDYPTLRVIPIFPLISKSLSGIFHRPVSLRFADFRENWKRTGGGDVSSRPRFAAKQRRTTARRRRRQSNDAVKNIDPNRAAIVREIIIEITNASFFSTLATFESSIEPSNDKIKQFATSISMERCRDIGRETSS